DARFRDRKGRQENHDALTEELQAIFRKGRREDWLKRLQERDVPCAPLNTIEEVFSDPQVRSYGFPVEVEHPKMGKVRLVGSGIDMSRTPPQIRIPPPALGEHTEEVLGALGYDRTSLSRLMEQGVI
ncbi:MAG: CoA transferase, partial [Deltaproteobacteria bacterium]|nr:CoA transferase [Deltaproteobacteria bacterium]